MYNKDERNKQNQEKNIELGSFTSNQNLNTSGAIRGQDDQTVNKGQENSQSVWLDWVHDIKPFLTSLRSQGKGAAWSMVLTGGSAVSGFALNRYTNAPISVIAAMSTAFLNAGGSVKLFYVNDYIKNKGLPKLKSPNNGDLVWLKTHINSQSSILGANETARLDELYQETVSVIKDAEATAHKNVIKVSIDFFISLALAIPLGIFFGLDDNDESKTKTDDNNFQAVYITFILIYLFLYVAGLAQNSKSDTCKFDITRIGSKIEGLRENFESREEDLVQKTGRIIVNSADQKLNDTLLETQRAIAADLLKESNNPSGRGRITIREYGDPPSFRSKTLPNYTGQNSLNLTINDGIQSFDNTQTIRSHSPAK